MGGARDESVTGAGGRGRGRGRAIRRRRFAALVLAFSSVAHNTVSAREPMPDAAFLQWSGWLERRSLDDGSVLSEYLARTGSPDDPDVTLSIGFVPRFDCTPVLGVRVVGDLSADVGEALDDGDRLTFSIDGEGADVVLLVDDDGRATTLWFDAAADDRERIRRLIDEGSRASLGLPGESTLSFSLLGSRRSAAAVEVACRTHEPLPYEDAR